MSGFNPAVTGAGSQPRDADAAELDYMEMPKDMRTYSMPEIPEPDEVSGLKPALDLLETVRAATATCEDGGSREPIDLSGLDIANRAFIDQVLGEGEVSVVAGDTIQAQESVLAGIWRVHTVDQAGRLIADTIEIGAFPSSIAAAARADTATELQPYPGRLPDGVLNAPALITELDDKIGTYRPGVEPHVVNLTLLPQTEEDLAFLDDRLGKGPVTILSRGYGNCRITSTATRDTWWVQYFNSRDAIILNTIEVVAVPGVACAAIEDLEDSAQRLGEILGVYR